MGMHKLIGQTQMRQKYRLYSKKSEFTPHSEVVTLEDYTLTPPALIAAKAFLKFLL